MLDDEGVPVSDPKMSVRADLGDDWWEPFVGAGDEAKAVLENALGFALAAQDDFAAAIGHYRTALKAKSEYPVAINNLAFANQKLNQYEEATKLYKEVLDLDPKNKTAKINLIGQNQPNAWLRAMYINFERYII